MSLKTAQLQFIIPAERTNLVTNPTPYAATTGYTVAYSGAIARVTTQTRRGIASIEITPASGSASGVYRSVALTAGVQYSFGADILDVLGQSFALRIADAATSTEIYDSSPWTGTGYWKRRAITFTPLTTANYYLIVYRAAIASTTPFYTDGWQIEEGAASTYFDGNSIGFRGEKDVYRWNGTPNASTSWRSGQTRSGGTYLNLSTYAKLITTVGLGMGMISNLAVPSVYGGSYYQDTVPNDRRFTVVAAMTGAGDYAAIEAKRKALINAIKPDLVTKKQPLLMQYDQLDANGSEISETLMIQAVYESGLEGDGSGNAYNEKVALNFKSYLPYLQQQGEHGAALGYQTALANANYLVMRSSAGVWSVLSTSISSAVYEVHKASKGGVYIGGAFTNLTDANGDYISYWNGTAFSSLASGLSSNAQKMTEGPSGTLYVVGDFENAGGDANADRFAKWNGTAFSAVGAGLNFTAYDIAMAERWDDIHCWRFLQRRRCERGLCFALDGFSMGIVGNRIVTSSVSRMYIKRRICLRWWYFLIRRWSFRNIVNRKVGWYSMAAIRYRNNGRSSQYNS